MNIFRTIATTTALAAALALPLAAPLSAGEASEDIVVRSQAAMDEWQEDTTAELDRLLARAPTVRTAAPNDTIVQVTFTMDEAGRAKDIKVLDGDANWGARRTAIYAIERLSSLSEVPVSNARNAKFLANLIFAQNKATHARLAAKLQADKATRFAAGDTAEDYIQIGG